MKNFARWFRNLFRASNPKSATLWIAMNDGGTSNIFSEEPKSVKYTDPTSTRREQLISWEEGEGQCGYMLPEHLVKLLGGSSKKKARKLTVSWED